MNIFWSWQNDSSPERNRHFIADALTDAIASLVDDFVLEAAGRPELDHDTKGVPGLAEIPAVLFAKIAASAVFIADVTPLVRTAKGKALPNPNVLLELGWALNKPGAERIIVVLNKADGWKIEDLPFDIRHRSVLTYSLAEGVDGNIKEAINKELAHELAGAIRICIRRFLQDEAGDKIILGRPALQGDPSIWATPAEGFQHFGAFGSPMTTTVKVPDGPRAYIRVIPSGWRGAPPSVADVRACPDDLVVWPPSNGFGNGDYGVTADGFVRYWLDKRATEERESSNVAMYFDETGEFWILQGTAVFSYGARQILGLETVFSAWAAVLRRTNRLLDHFGAYPLRRVEIGLTKLSGVQWPSQQPFGSSAARKSTFTLSEQKPLWGEEDRHNFLAKAYQGVVDLFGFDRISAEAVDAFLKLTDPG